ncbi:MULTISPECIES: hypothetical protein [unclassified Pseudoalteromonas]|uniref:hypothetical protein n=1 Tax=unclassified Pseudoalteromonas TaxID=194690 RepID=UPI0016018D26|nr:MULTISPECIES: hypothetical protein [unclassified Pseudoalteromonas]MBB1335866.1 hypothetical protein [Pseudoalteromonas sp. SR41-6]MBB1461475.1 hypothetical protein [Pseudoalteromonas sp. SG41-8]
MLTHKHEATFKTRWQATRLQVSNKHQSKFNTVGVELADAQREDNEGKCHGLRATRS